VDEFVEACVAAAKEARAQEAVREVLVRAASEPRALLAAVGEPVRAGSRSSTARAP
jgi:hypothetical protein